MVLSSAKISESKMISKLSEKVKPTQEISEILIPEMVSDLVKSKPIEVKIHPKPDLVKTDSVVKPDSHPTAIREVSVIGYGSNDTTNNSEIFTNVEVLPSFPGGIQAFGKFLAQNLRYPKVAHDAGIQGRVFCQFVVEKDGSLSNIKVVRGIGGGCDEEAVRVLAISPKWKPGLQNGKIVRVSYTIPIFFQLKDENKSASPPPPPIDFSSENRPLIFVDGVECKDEETFKKLNPKTIDHVDVLKGKSATEKYGDKGKNGVILITSKKK
jgi:TonB family protein